MLNHLQVCPIHHLLSYSCSLLAYRFTCSCFQSAVLLRWRRSSAGTVPRVVVGLWWRKKNVTQGWRADTHLLEDIRGEWFKPGACWKSIRHWCRHWFYKYHCCILPFRCRLPVRHWRCTLKWPAAAPATLLCAGKEAVVRKRRRRLRCSIADLNPND